MIGVIGGTAEVEIPLLLSSIAQSPLFSPVDIYHPGELE